MKNILLSVLILISFNALGEDAPADKKSLSKIIAKLELTINLWSLTVKAAAYSTGGAILTIIVKSFSLEEQGIQVKYTRGQRPLLLLMEALWPATIGTLVQVVKKLNWPF